MGILVNFAFDYLQLVVGSPWGKKSGVFKKKINFPW
jgi:hypothetical protein